MDSHRYSQNNPYSDQTWSELYKFLTSYVKPLVYNSGVSSWRGQEYYLIEDIVQGAIEHVFIYLKKVERGEAPPIVSLHHFSKTTAYHYYLDLRRKEARIVRPEMEDDVENAEEPLVRLAGAYDPIRTKLDALMLAESFVPVARLIKSIAPKQRLALLTDLAHLHDFDEELAPLEQALSQVNILLRDYQGLRPTQKHLKGRYTSSLSIAYKKLRLLARIHRCKNDFVA